MTRTARRILVVAALGIAVLAGVSIVANVREIADRLAGFAWWAFAAALALAATNYVIRFGRWQLYLRRAEVAVPPRTSALVFVAGFALSVTPGKVGELIKSYLLRHIGGIPITRTAPIVVAERITDLVALLLLGLVGVLAYGIARGIVFGGCALVGGGLVVLAWPRLARALIHAVSAPRRLRRLRPRLLEVYDGLVHLVRPWPLLWGTAIGVVAWLAECLGFALIVGGFPGTAVPLGLAILIYAVTTVAGALSFLPGGLIVTETAMAVLLAESSHADRATAAAATILTRLATLWFAVVLGVGALALLRRHAPGSARALDAPADLPADPL